MSTRTLLPSLATVFAAALLGVSILFLLESLEKTNTNMATSSEVAEFAPTPSDSDPLVEQVVPVDIYLVVSRPLFSPSRRIPESERIPEVVVQAPETPSPQIAVAPPVMPPKIAMIGVLEDDGSLMALIKRRDGTEQWVKHGAEIEGWSVATIAPQSITLQLNGESVDIYAVE